MQALSEADRIDGVPDGRHGASVAPVSEHDAEAAETAEALWVRRGLVTCEWHGASAWSEQSWEAEIAARQNLQLEASRPKSRGKRAMLEALGVEEGADEAEDGTGRDEEALAGLEEEVAELGRQEDAEDDAGTSDRVRVGC